MLPLELLPRVLHTFVIALKSLGGVRGQLLQSLLFLLPAGLGSACELAGIVRTREVVVTIVWHVSTIVDVLLGFERPNFVLKITKLLSPPPTPTRQQEKKEK